VATGLAFALAKPDPVALAELGSGTPELALALDLQPKHSLAELIRESERVDVSMIRDVAVPHAAGVSVLAYTPESLAPAAVTPAVARDFQVLLRSAFAWSVADAGHGLGAGTEELLTHSDAVVVVTRLDPPALRLTRRYLATLAEHGVPVEEVAVVANRYGQPGLVPWKKAEESLQANVFAWLPDDPASVNGALLAGRPLAEAAGRSRLARELAKLATELRARLAPAAR
jgi:pilus assembly protein CpaE